MEIKVGNQGKDAFESAKNCITKTIGTLENSLNMLSTLKHVMDETCDLRQELFCSRSMSGKKCMECQAFKDKALYEQEEAAVANKTCHKRYRLVFGHKLIDDCCREDISVGDSRRNCEMCPALPDLLDLLCEQSLRALPQMPESVHTKLRGEMIRTDE